MYKLNERLLFKRQQFFTNIIKRTKKNDICCFSAYHTALRRNVSVALILRFRYSSLMALYIKSQKACPFSCTGIGIQIPNPIDSSSDQNFERRHLAL